MTLQSPPLMSASWKPGGCGGRTGRSLHPEHAGPREVVEVVPRALRQRAVLPVTGEGADDERGFAAQQRRVTEARAGRARPGRNCSKRTS